MLEAVKRYVLHQFYTHFCKDMKKLPEEAIQELITILKYEKLSDELKEDVERGVIDVSKYQEKKVRDIIKRAEKIIEKLDNSKNERK